MLALQNRHVLTLLRSQICRSQVNTITRHFHRSLAHFSDIKSEEIITPWYVNEALKSAKLDSNSTQIKLPPLPSDCPKCLPKIVEYAIKDMGLKDVIVIDKQAEDEIITSALGPAVMVLGTVTSAKHLNSAGQLLKTWIKREYGVHAGREGILTTNFVNLHNRRQKRRQQKQRFAANNTSQLQRVGNWVAIDTKLDNIYVHLMTAERREEIDLQNINEWFKIDAESENDHVLEKSFVDPNLSKTVNELKGTRKYSTNAARDAIDELSNSQSKSTGLIPESREVLALENILSDPRSDLTEDDTAIKDFIKFFPEFPARQDWRNRLEFFAVATIQSSFMPLNRIMEEAELQQSSGYVLDDDDIETVLTAICYHGQAFISNLPRNDDTIWAWKSSCDVKASLISHFFEVCMRPLGKSIMTNPRLLTLLYRTFTGTCRPSGSSTADMENSDDYSEKFDILLDTKRCAPIRYLLETTGEMSNLQTVSMIMSSLCQEPSFDAFWKITTGAALTGENSEFSQSIAELATLLVVKSGDKTQIKFAIMNYIPNCISKSTVRLSEKMVRSLETGLKILESDQKGNYDAIREMLRRYHSVESAKLN